MATIKGTTFRELIQHATGKSDASREDFESTMAARGYRRSDVHKLGKAFDRAKESGNEYVLDDKKGFSVLDQAGKQLTGSGKKKGNKAGLDLGDLIGLGTDTSLLAGALRNELGGYKESKTPKVDLTPEIPAFKSEESSTAKPAQEQSKAPSKGTTQGKPTAKNFDFNPDRFKVKPLDNPGLGIGESPLKGKKASISDLLDESDIDDNVSASALADKSKTAGSKEKGWTDFFLGDLPLLWDKENYQKLGKMYNPAQIWDENAREEARNLPGEMDDVQGEGMPNFGIFTPGPPAKNLLQPTAKQLERTLLDNARKMKVNFGSYRNNAVTTIKGLLGQGTRELPQGLGQSVYEVGPAHVKVPYEHGFGTPGTPEYFPAGGYKKGGKLPEYADGGLSPYKAPVGDEVDNRSFFNFDNYNPEGDFHFNLPSINPVPSQLELGPKPEFREKAPIEDNNSAQFPWGDVVSGAVKYGIPAGYLGAEQHQIHKLRSLINPHLQSPELMTGTVQDMYRPDFSLPYHPDQGGSSLTESQGIGLARDKYSRDARLAWEQQNSASKIAQKNAVVDRTNQQAIQNANVKNQESLIKSGNAFNEFAYLLNDRGQTAGSLFQNLDQGIYGSQVTHDARSLSLAQDIIHNPEKYATQPGAYEWAKSLARGIYSPKSSGFQRKKQGGKLKMKALLVDA